MRARDLCAAFTILALVAGVREAAAQDDSPFYVRLDIGGSMHPSDRNIETYWYPAGPDYANFTDREAKMMYHFDQKFGASLTGAAGFRFTKELACEIGIGYAIYSVNEINQNSRERALQEGLRVNWATDYPEAEGSDFSSIVIRPAVTFRPSLRGTIVPYVGAGFNVHIFSGSGEFVFEIPGTSIAGLPPELAPLSFDGTDVFLGFDMASGLEVRLGRTFALHVGASYAFMGKAFDEFHEFIVDEELAREFESIGYTFDGLSFSGLRAAVGVIWYP